MANSFHLIEFVNICLRGFIVYLAFCSISNSYTFTTYTYKYNYASAIAYNVLPESRSQSLFAKLILQSLAKLAWCYWGPRKLQVSISQLLTGVANALNGPKYPKGVSCLNAHTAIMQTCRKVTIANWMIHISSLTVNGFCAAGLM